MSRADRTTSRGPSRRSVLKGAAAAAGAAAGSGAIGGYPTIWAQNIKDIVLRHSGPPVTAIPRVAEQATKDLGFTVQMQAVENADLINRFLSQSNTMDCADVSLVYMRYIIGRNVLQAIPVSKAKHWDKTLPLFTKGEFADGRKAPQQGITPTMILYATGADGQKVTDGKPTEWVTGVPTVTNADTLGIRPDLLRVRMREELKRLQRDLGITFIHVTHAQDEAMALADLMVVMDGGRIRQTGSPAEVFEQPASAFVARFIGGHNVLPWKGGMIAVRTDQCVIEKPAGADGLTGRVSNVEYQGPTIRIALTTRDGLEAAAVLRDHVFKERPVSTGDEVTLSWPEQCAHRLAA